jgi:zinc protease
MKIQKIMAVAGAAALLAGSFGLAQEGPGDAAAPGKRPHRKWQDVTQPPLEKFADPKPVTATLRNGMKVFLIEDHELPTVDVVLETHAGELDLAALFTEGGAARMKAGLAGIAGQVMRTGGTESRTGDELDEALDGMAASVETSAGLDQGHARMSCLKENLDATLAIFADVVKHPAFREEKVALAKKQHLGAIRRRNDNPAQIASREFARLMFGDASPLGWTEEAATVDSITRDDLVRFYKSSFAFDPKSALLGAVGDFDAAKMKEKLDAALGDWAPAADAARAKVMVQLDGFQSPAPKVYLVRKPDVNQSTVVLGHVGFQRRPGDADYPAAVVANSVMSGGFAGRLMQHVRTEMGLAYGVSSRIDAAMGHQGTFVMQGQTKSGSTLAMSRAMRKELERLVAEPPSAEELRVAKASILEKLVFSSEQKSQVLDRVLRNEYYGFPQDELEVFQKGVAAVTAEDCMRVAKKLFRPEQLTTLVVGNDAEFDGKVEELGGPVTLIDVKKPPVGGGGGRASETSR